MKSDLELAIESSKTLESLLEKNYAATGRGLHEKLDSVSSRLPPNVIRDARFIATVRNKIVHEVTTQSIEDRPRFTTVVQRLVQALSAAPDGPNVTATATPALSAAAVHPTAACKKMQDYFEARATAPAVAISPPITRPVGKSASHSAFLEFLARSHRFIGLLSGALAVFVFVPHDGTEFLGNLFFSAVGGFFGYWWDRVLAGVAILGATAAAIGLLYWFASRSQS